MYLVEGLTSTPLLDIAKEIWPSIRAGEGGGTLYHGIRHHYHRNASK